MQLLMRSAWLVLLLAPGALGAQALPGDEVRALGQVLGALPDELTDPGVAPHIVDIDAGGSTSFALSASGRLYAWGLNDFGQLGLGDRDDRDRPTRLSLPERVVSVVTTGYHSLAVTSVGTVYAWGFNTYGQVGDGSFEHRDVPALVEGLTDIVAVGTGAGHSLAVDAAGRVFAWGRNHQGQLGIGTLTDTPLPTLVQLDGPARSISGGSDTTFCLMADGTVRSWGDNTYGFLAAGMQVDSPVPVPVLGVDDAKALSCDNTTAYVLAPDGRVRGWGWDGYGLLADGGCHCGTDHPVDLQLDATIVHIVGPSLHGLARTDGGRVVSWGYNAKGQCGRGPGASNSLLPGLIPDFGKVVDIDVGHDHSLALRADGTVFAFGWNNFGQIGDGTHEERPSPVEVSFP